MQIEWKDKQIKALLRLPKHPASILQKEPYWSWFLARGGVDVVRHQLRQERFSEEAQPMLRAIMQQPQTSAEHIARSLHIGRTTYFHQLKSLLIELRAWLDHLPSQINTLPAPMTELIGVDALIEQISMTMYTTSTRLLTLIGMGGIGKTRMSIAVGERLQAHYPQGVYFINLLEVQTAQLVAEHIAKTMGVRLLGYDSAQDGVIAYLQNRQVVLILDNFEHVMNAKTIVQNLLRWLPSLKILVTSREALQIYGEHLVPIPTLPVDQAVELFFIRSKAVNPYLQFDSHSQEMVEQFCLRLDGMPLAIELLAVQTRYATIAQLHEQLSVQGGMLHLPTQRYEHDRQETVAKLFEWSYQLLSADLQKKFRQLSVFVAGWDIQAAEAIVGMTVQELYQFADKHLIQIEPVGTTIRFKMLELMREYGTEKMVEMGDSAEVSHRHALYFLEKIKEVMISGATESDIQYIQQEEPNWRVALQYFIDNHHATEAIELCNSLIQYWFMMGYGKEARVWITQVIETFQEEKSAAFVGLLRHTLGILIQRDEFEQVKRYCELAYKIAQQLSDTYSLGMSLSGLGQIATIEGRYEDALAYVQKSVDLSTALYGEPTPWENVSIAGVYLAQQSAQPAIDVLVEAEQQFEQQQTILGQIIVKNNLGRAYVMDKQWRNAEKTFLSGIADGQRVGDSRWELWIRANLGRLYLLQEKPIKALEQFQIGVEMVLNGVLAYDIVLNLEGIAQIAFMQEKDQISLHLFGAADKIRTTIVALDPNLFPDEDVERQAVLTQLRMRVDAAEYEDWWVNGREQSFHDLLPFTLARCQQLQNEID